MKKTILVVDDEDCVCDLMGMVLGGAGCDVVFAKNGYEALEKAGDKRLNLIIVDLLMPGMNGAKTIKAIKMLRPELPVVILTGLRNDPLVEEAIKAGAERALFKPIRISKLMDCINDILDIRLILR